MSIGAAAWDNRVGGFLSPVVESPAHGRLAHLFMNSSEYPNIMC